MESRTKRVLLRATGIGVQWIGLTIALGSLVMRSDQSFSQLISPHLGAAPVFFAAAVAGFLLGLTIESPRYLAPLAILMAICASAFVGLLSYAPVVDGLLVRTPGLDNYVAQRILLMTLIIMMPMIPAAVGGNLLGSNLRIRQEIAPHPEDLVHEQEVPWWEQRDESRPNADPEAGQRPV